MQAPNEAGLRAAPDLTWSRLVAYALPCAR